MRRSAAFNGPRHWIAWLAVGLPFGGFVTILALVSQHPWAPARAIALGVAVGCIFALMNEALWRPSTPWAVAAAGQGLRFIDLEARRIAAADAGQVLFELERLSDELLDQPIPPWLRWMNGGETPPLYASPVQRVWEQVLTRRRQDLPPSEVAASMQRVQDLAVAREGGPVPEVVQALERARVSALTRSPRTSAG